MKKIFKKVSIMLVIIAILAQTFNPVVVHATELAININGSQITFNTIRSLFSSIVKNDAVENNEEQENKVTTNNSTSYKWTNYENNSNEQADSKEDNISKTKDLNDFTEKVAEISSNDSLESNNIYSTKRLIVISNTSDFDAYGAEVISYGNMYILSYETEKECRIAYELLYREPSISSVEIDTIMETEETNTSENSNETKQPKETELKKYLESVNISKNVKVAILDTGIDINNFGHKNRIVDTKINLSTSGNKDSIDDDNGHGTEIATIIAENSNDNVKILPIKIANSEGKATVLNAYIGIQKAIENNVDIINISMNTKASSQSKILEDLIDEASKKGILVVVSAGNNSTYTSNITPANVETAIVVSAIDNNNILANYSNYGTAVDYCSYGAYGEKNGTSYAAANVSGIIANALSKNINIDEIENYAIDLGYEGTDTYYGKGLISTYIMEERTTSNNEVNIGGSSFGDISEDELKTSSKLGGKLLIIDGEDKEQWTQDISTWYTGYIKKVSNEDNIELGNIAYEYNEYGNEVWLGGHACYFGNNTEQKDEAYIKYKKAAYYNGEWLDLKIFLWSKEGNWYVTKDSMSLMCENNKSIDIQFAFYKDNTEVEFRGIASISDLDNGEGVKLKSGFDGVRKERYYLR